MAADLAAKALKDKYTDINIVGLYCPPFGFEKDTNENARIIEMIRKADPDILFVGLGAPKQEKWIYAHRHDFKVPVSIGIGAGFEFVSGMVKRAPKWMQGIGMEWLWRLAQEPGRLWKRYLVDDMSFFWLVLKQRFKKRDDHASAVRK
jgi:N-acetylglucosaminyldiphosphoundecaprenol N-acetyl-beta-D-mannosaminyltransferase